jgi:SOS-response transcriptional repressor LexA
MEAPDGYWTGDVVLISPALQPQPDDDVLVKLRGETHPKVRRLQYPRRRDLASPEGKRWLILLPLNRRYPPDLVSEEEIESMHKVICIVLRCVGK